MHPPPPENLDWDALPAAFPGFSAAERWLPLLREHYRLLTAAEATVRATAVDPAGAPSRLYAESLETLRLALGHGERPVERYIDVGSGGGFPGIVAATLFPAWESVLIEAHGRKAALLRKLANAMELTNVTVVHARAEDAGHGPLRESACLVTARAVAELRVALEYTSPLARVGGVIALPKGSRLPDEENDAANAIRELGVEYVSRDAMRAEVSLTPWTAIFRKREAAPAKYPRRAGVPARRPL